MKLFISPTSPYARLCRAAIIEKGMSNQVETIKTDPWESAQTLLDANTFSKIPSLVLDDGLVLTESVLIATYLDDVGTGASLFGGMDRKNLLRKLGFAFGIIDAAVAIASAKKFGTEVDDDPILKRRHAAIERSLPAIDDLKMSPGDYVDIGDLALAVALGYLGFRFESFDWRAKAPKASEWYQRVSQRPAISQTMPG